MRVHVVSAIMQQYKRTFAAVVIDAAAAAKGVALKPRSSTILSRAVAAAEAAYPQRVAAVEPPYKPSFINIPVPEGPEAMGGAPGESRDGRAARVKQYIEDNRNQNTKAAYASGLAGFRRYLARIQVDMEQVTEAEVADYLRERVEEQKVAASTVQGDRAAIMDHLRHTAQERFVAHPLVTSVIKVLTVRATQSKPKRHVTAMLMKDILLTHSRRQRAAGPAATGKELEKAWRAERDVCLLYTMMSGMLR